MKKNQPLINAEKQARQIIVIFCFTLILLLILAGCQSQRPLPTGYQTILVEQIPTASTTGSIMPTAVPTTAPTATPQPTANITTTPSTTETAVPAPTSLPIISIYLPPQWQAIAPQTLNRLNETASAFHWQLNTNEQDADIRLNNSEEGIPLYQEPLALVVPFNATWDNTDQITAEGIIENGHQLVKVMPWRTIHRTQKAMRIDGSFPTDIDYPFHETWSLMADAGYETAVSTAIPILQETMADPAIHLAAVGDIMLDRTLGTVIADGGIEFPFKLVAEPLQNADITIGNLETALGDIGEPVEKSYTFQSPPAAAESLAWAGFDIISLANNHAMDYGPDALLQGIELLKAQNIMPIGAGSNAAQARAPHILNVNGTAVAFLGYVHVPVEARGNYFDTAIWTATETTPGLAWAIPEEIVEDVTAVQSQADLIVVVLHSGYEYVEPPSEEQTAAAHAAIDAGADIVIGHHAHILQAVEFYKNGVIAYGLGNFAFNIDGDPNTAILNVWLDENGVRQFEFIPAIIQYGGQPRLAETWEARQPIISPSIPLLQRGLLPGLRPSVLTEPQITPKTTRLIYRK
jgi:poly-gamma-glutamate capsule biosynthesis protein CapA/YwtB (metallophosphatase superfamily)